MISNKFGDKELILAIQQEDAIKRNKALEILYNRFFSSTERYVLNNSGSTEEAKDVFQDGIVALYRNVNDGRFKYESAIGSYIFSICRNIWLMRLRKKGRKIEFDEDHSYDLEIPITFDQDLLNKFLHDLSEECRELLLSFYYKKHSMKDIKGKFNLKSEQIAKTKKYRCMQDLIAVVRHQGLTIESFIK